MVILPLLAACAGGPGPAGVGPVEVLGAVCPDTPDTSRLATPPRTVVTFIVDTTRRDFLGFSHPDWDTTPHLDALAAEGTRYDHVQATRGLTAVALSSVQTGAYPRTHLVRNNDGGTVSPSTPTLQERFSAAGFHTYGMSANMCQLMDVGIDERFCASVQDDATRSQRDADDLLVPAFFAALDARPADEPAYAWIHFVEPHDPYQAHEPWYAEFHPDAYDGPLDPPTHDALAQVSAGELPYTDEDARFVEAVYASQIRATDEHLGELVEGLAARGRLDDTLILFAMDHGEELGQRSGYFYHGCAASQLVLDVSAVVWAPGRVPAGEVLAAPVSAVDLAPTVLEATGLPWDGPGEGRSLVGDTVRCVEPQRTPFFERGVETAGILSGGWAYILDPRAGYADCNGYDDTDPYPGEPRALYALADDPLELDNRVTAEPTIADTLAGELCGWVTRGPWIPEADTSANALLIACAP